MRLVVVLALVACGDGGPVGNELPSLEQRRALTDEVCPRVTHPYFYRVDKAGRTSYLLGSRHIGVALTKFPQAVRDTIFAQHVIVFETPHHAKGPDIEGPPAREALGREGWERFHQVAGDRLADAVATKPVPVAMISLATKYDNFEHALEREIWEQADKLHIPTRGLETADFQLGVLTKVMNARMVNAGLRYATSNALRLEMMKELDDYCTGRDRPEFTPGGEASLVAAGYSWPEIADFEDTMIYRRNRSWIPQLEQLFAEGGAAVVVGAGHLRGDRGVPELLRAKGYTVTRVDQ
jgi:uncharacterized protein YbaP (TraB family)